MRKCDVVTDEWFARCHNLLSNNCVPSEPEILFKAVGARTGCSSTRTVSILRSRPNTSETSRGESRCQSADARLHANEASKTQNPSQARSERESLEFYCFNETIRIGFVSQNDNKIQGKLSQSMEAAFRWDQREAVAETAEEEQMPSADAEKSRKARRCLTTWDRHLSRVSVILTGRLTL